MLGAPAVAPAAASAPVGAVSILASAQPGELSSGGTLSVTGKVLAQGAPAGGVAVALEASPYPYRAWEQIYRSDTQADGSFGFGRYGPVENTRMRVSALAPAAGASATLPVLVDPRATLRAADLGPGRVRLSVKIEHVEWPHAPPVAVRWYLAARGSRTFRLAAVTQSSERGGTYASAIVDPPARRFSFRVCLNPAWEAAMGPPASHGPCPSHAFRLAAAGGRSAHRPRARAALEFGGEGRGTPLAPFPGAAAVSAARSYLRARAGRTSFAVLDSAGRLSGLNVRERFETASVVKVMFLTAYLQMLAARHRALEASDRALLYPMIHESDNEAASRVLSIVGGAAVARVAGQAGMRDYAPGVGWWAYSLTSAADQVRFMAQLGRLIPARFYGYARHLMATIEPEQSWGFPPVARPRWQVFFKTGALPSQGLFNEVALLERGPIHFTVAVFDDGDPSQAYGEETIAGVAARLLGVGG